MDIADEAERLEQYQRDIALANLRARKMDAAKKADDGHYYCVDCSGKISDARAQALLSHHLSVSRCITCASQKELRNGL